MTERALEPLKIGGLARLSSVDWPGELVATVFLRGCPWRCPYCHNRQLLSAQPTEGERLLPWPDVLRFLEGRVGLLDGVVFSGGEPLAQEAVIDAAEQVAGLGLKVGLHTNGTSPERLARLLPSLSWVGFDIKAPFADYERVTGVAGSGQQTRESLRVLCGSGVPFEVRTTLDPAIHGADAVVRMADELAEAGVRRWVIQPARNDGESTASPSRLAQVEAMLAGVVATRFEAIAIRT